MQVLRSLALTNMFLSVKGGPELLAAPFKPCKIDSGIAFPLRLCEQCEGERAARASVPFWCRTVFYFSNERAPREKRGFNLKSGIALKVNVHF